MRAGRGFGLFSLLITAGRGNFLARRQCTYTVEVDRVRLGRALGYGTRHAAKTVAAVVEAAAAPSPRQTTAPKRRQSESPASGVDFGRGVPRPSDVARGARTFRRSFWGPLAVFSGALWLRVSGSFFGLLAMTMGSSACRLHQSLGWSGVARSHRFWLFAAFTLLFGYFAVSSFVRASLKERRATAAGR